MSTNALRGLVLAGNLLLIGIVLWTSYLTFRFVDQDRWHVAPPRFEKFRPPVLDDDPLMRERAVYDLISEMFDKKPEVVAVDPTPVEPPKEAAPPPGDPKHLVVVLSQYAESGSGIRSTVMLRTPGGRVERPFTVGMKLDDYEEFKLFKYIVKDITPDAIVLAEQKGGQEFRLDSKPTGGTPAASRAPSGAGAPSPRGGGR